MIILDENIIGGERDILKRWKSSIRQIGFDIARKGLEDVELIPFLLRLSQPTFLTRDNDFYRSHLSHKKYSLVWFDVSAIQFAEYARRFLQHERFKTNVSRLGKVFRVSVGGIAFWTVGESGLHAVKW